MLEENTRRHFHDKMKLIIGFLVAVMVLSVPVKAQFYNGSNMSFGKNRIQWKSFHWTYYRSNVIDVYFYPGGEELAQYAHRYASTQVSHLEEQFSTRFDKKIQLIIFNSLSDFKQSNIGLKHDEKQNIGGTTHLLGSKVILYFDGNYVNFERQIREGIAQLLLNRVIYGVSIGSQVRNSYRFDVPEWYQKGLTAYFADTWDCIKEERLQEGIVTGRYRKINNLNADDAAIAGYSFWIFIEERYGAQAMADIIELTRTSKNVKKGVQYATGQSFKELTQQWYSYFLQRYSHINSYRPSQQFKLRYAIGRTFTEPEISPQGNYMAYVANDEGKITIWLEDLVTGKRKKLFKTGYRHDEYIDTSYPLLSWHPNGYLLAFIIEEHGNNMLCFLDVRDGESTQRPLFEFQKITNFSFDPKGEKLVLSASRNGMPNIFVYNLFSNTFEQITHDYFTDKDPVFSADGRKIIFASNRNNDTITPLSKPTTQDRQFNLFAYDYSTKNNILLNITHQKISSSVSPKITPEGRILFLNDSSGYYNIYEAQFDSVIHHIDTAVHYRHFATYAQVTDYSSNIIDYTVKPHGCQAVLLMPDKAGQRFFTAHTDDYVKMKQTSPYAQKRLLWQRAKTIVDSTSTKTTPHRFVTSYRPAKRSIDVDTIANTDAAKQGTATLTNEDLERMSRNLFADRVKQRDTTLRKWNYYNELFYEELISQIDFSYINYSYQPFSGGNNPIFLNPSINFFLGTILSDLMEDYRIELGVKLNTSLVNNEYIIQFSDYSKRLDKTITLHRYVIDDYKSGYYYRTFSNEAFYTLSYPFTETFSLRGTAIYRNDCKVNLAVDNSSLHDKNTYENWGGLRMELVLDNSRKLETNIMAGTRAKVFGEYYQLIGRNTTNLIVTGFDFRNYQKIHRNFIWANRLAGSTSLGNSYLIYYMGGVDNWILPQFDRRNEIDHEMNYSYQTLATNLRGFSQNIRNGNTFVVFNSELRLPIFSYLINSPIQMEFIRNFQLVAFGDIGSAWTGWNPYNPNNSFYTSHIESGSLNITVTEQKDPFVGGLGLGLRSTLFGYFIRFDVAWGFDERKFNNTPKCYFSLNLDF